MAAWPGGASAAAAAPPGRPGPPWPSRALSCSDGTSTDLPAGPSRAGLPAAADGSKRPARTGCLLSLAGPARGALRPASARTARGAYRARIGGSGLGGQRGGAPRRRLPAVPGGVPGGRRDRPRRGSSATWCRLEVTVVQEMCSSLTKFRVIPGECPVERRQLVIICPYPFCNASWKSGLGYPVDLVRRRSLLGG